MQRRISRLSVRCLRGKLTIDGDQHQYERHGLESDKQRLDGGLDNRDTAFARDGLTDGNNRGIGGTGENAQYDGHNEHQEQD